MKTKRLTFEQMLRARFYVHVKNVRTGRQGTSRRTFSWADADRLMDLVIKRGNGYIGAWRSPVPGSY